MKAIKNLMSFSIATAVAISSCAFAAAPNDVKEIRTIQDNEVLRVGVKNDVQGFSLKDPLSGEYTGFEDSLATLIAKEIGDDVEVEFTAVTAATRSELIDSGDLDCVLATFTITEDRKKNWDFSTPYYTDAVSVLVEEKSNIHHLKDLVGKTVGVSSGSTSARELVRAMIENGILDAASFDPDKFAPSTWTNGVKFHQFDNYPAISTALAANEVQAFCVDKSILNIYKTKGRTFIDEKFSPQQYGVVTKKNSGLSPFIDSLIKKWLADGTIDKLIKENNL